MSVPPEPRITAHGDEHEPPPILGTWRALYALEIAALALTIALLALLSRGCS